MQMKSLAIVVSSAQRDHFSEMKSWWNKCCSHSFTVQGMLKLRNVSIVWSSFSFNLNFKHVHWKEVHICSKHKSSWRMNKCSVEDCQQQQHCSPNSWDSHWTSLLWLNKNGCFKQHIEPWVEAFSPAFCYSSQQSWPHVWHHPSSANIDALKETLSHNFCSTKHCIIFHRNVECINTVCF